MFRPSYLNVDFSSSAQVKVVPRYSLYIFHVYSSLLLDALLYITLRKSFTLAAFALKFLEKGVGYTDQENKTKHGNSKP